MCVYMFVCEDGCGFSLYFKFKVNSSFNNLCLGH